MLDLAWLLTVLVKDLDLLGKPERLVEPDVDVPRVGVDFPPEACDKLLDLPEAGPVRELLRGV